MSEWQIELIGNDNDIELLESLLANSPYSITTWEGRKLLTIPGVSPKADIETVRAASDRLIDIINGAAKLYYKDFGGVSFVQVSRMKDDGNRIGFVYVTVPVDNLTVTVLDPNDKTLSEWIEIALSESEVARALYLFGSLELNWKNLYLVLEVIEDVFGGEAPLLRRNLVPENDIKLFKRTASSYKAIGREARHGTLQFESPPNPMKLEEAKELMYTLLQEWIKSKQSKSA